LRRLWQSPFSLERERCGAALSDSTILACTLTLQESMVTVIGTEEEDCVVREVATQTRRRRRRLGVERQSGGKSGLCCGLFDRRRHSLLASCS